jgi:hypothetical protein
MTALKHTGRNAPQCQINRVQSKIDDFNPITHLLPRLHPAEVRKATERSFKGKVRPIRGQAIDLPQDHSGCGNRCQFRFQRRQTASNQIGVDEVNNFGDTGQVLLRKRCLPGSIRTRDDDATRFPSTRRHFDSSTTTSCSNPHLILWTCFALFHQVNLAESVRVVGDDWKAR